MLGPIEVTDGTRVIEVGARMPRAVLGMLLMHANAVVSVDRLIDNLWGDDPPATAMTALQGYVSTLRKALEPGRLARAPSRLLLTQPPGYRLCVPPESIDAVRFERLAAKGRALLAAGQAEAGCDALSRALELWRGTPYAEFSIEPFTQPEIARLNETRATVAEARAEAMLGVGRHADAIGELQSMVDEEPLRERRWELLALALYRCGRQGDALRSLSRARRILGEELGVDPGPAMRALEQEILAHSPSLEWRPPPRSDLLPTASAPPPGPAAGSGPTEPERPLVGREEEVAALLSAVDRAVAGRGGVALVAGEAGIGKTRLVEELARLAAERNAVVAWGRCHETDAAPAFWPWVQIIGAVLDACEPDAVRQALGGGAAHIVPDVKDVMGRELETPLLLDPECARAALYDAIGRFLRRLSERRPLVLIVDDLHRSDVASLQILGSLAERLGDVAVLVVVAYRDLEAQQIEPVLATLTRMNRQPGVTRVSLGGLSVAEVRRLVEAHTGTTSSEGVARAICARTEGNPFFVSELVALLRAQRRLGATDEDAVQREIPAGVRETIRLRLGRLPQETVRLLGVAAVIGMYFALDTLTAAADVDEERALDVVESALVVGVVLESGDVVGRYRFSHALVRDTLYEGLSGLRRARLHQRVAEALERQRPDDPPLVELADHFAKAAPVAGVEQAVDYAVRAAQWARASLAYEQAEAQLRQALELVGQMRPSPEREGRELDVQLRLAGLLTMAKGWTAPGVGQAWARAVALCGEAGQSSQVVAAMWGLWVSAIMGGETETAVHIGTQLAEVARTSGDGAATAVSEFAAGYLSLHRGEIVHALAPLRRAAQYSFGLDDRALVETLNVHPGVLALATLALACSLSGDEREMAGLRAQTLDLATRLDHPFSRVVALVIVGMVDAIRSDVPCLLGVSHEAVDVARQFGFHHYELFAGVLHGAAVAQGGAADAGTAEIEAALAGIESGGWLLQRPFFLALLADARRLSGRIDDALAAVDDALDVIALTDERFFEAELYRLRAEMLAQGPPERSTEAVESFQQALMVARAQGARALERRVAESLAREVATGS